MQITLDDSRFRLGQELPWDGPARLWELFEQSGARIGCAFFTPCSKPADRELHDYYKQRWQRIRYADGEGVAPLLHAEVLPAPDGSGLWQAALCEGFDPAHSLLRQSEARGSLPEAEILQIAHALGKALAALETHSHAHGRLHPGSVCWQNQRLSILHPLVAWAEEALEPLAPSCVAQHAAPERIHGLPRSMNSDIFSLGALLFTVSTGREPFAGDGMASMATDLLEQMLPDPRQFRADLSEGLASIICCAAAARPEQRYGNAAALVQDVENVRAGRPALGPQAAAPAAAPPSRSRPKRRQSSEPRRAAERPKISRRERSSRKRPMPIAAIVGLPLLALALGFIASQVGGNGTPPPIAGDPDERYQDREPDVRDRLAKAREPVPTRPTATPARDPAPEPAPSVEPTEEAEATPAESTAREAQSEQTQAEPAPAEPTPQPAPQEQDPPQDPEPVEASPAQSEAPKTTEQPPAEQQPAEPAEQQAAAQPADAINLRRGLQGYWPMDTGQGDRALDASGNEHHGSIKGAQWVTGRFGGALRFNGDASHVLLRKAPALQAIMATQNCSIAAWIKVTRPPPNSSNKDDSYAIFMRKGHHSGLRMQHHGNLQGILWVNSSHRPFIDSPPIAMKRFLHVVWSADIASGEQRISIDGKLAKQHKMGAGGAMTIRDSHWRIGCADPGRRYQWGFDGVIDELRLYNRVLNAEEVAALAALDPHQANQPSPPADDEPDAMAGNEPEAEASGPEAELRRALKAHDLHQARQLAGNLPPALQEALEQCLAAYDALPDTFRSHARKLRRCEIDLGFGIFEVTAVDDSGVTLADAADPVHSRTMLRWSRISAPQHFAMARHLLGERIDAATRLQLQRALALAGPPGASDERELAVLAKFWRP